jgi:hypothetical protein
VYLGGVEKVDESKSPSANIASLAGGVIDVSASRCHWSRRAVISSGNIQVMQGTIREHSGNIQGTFNIQGTLKEH